MLVLSESSGTSANPGGLVDGSAVSIKEVVDLRQGNGSQQGYVIYTKGSERQVVKIDGAVTTVMQDGQPKPPSRATTPSPPAMGPWASMARAPIPAISPPKTSSMSIGKARAQSRRAPWPLPARTDAKFKIGPALGALAHWQDLRLIGKREEESWASRRRCLQRVISGHCSADRGCPLCPRSGHSSGAFSMSAKCQ